MVIRNYKLTNQTAEFKTNLFHLEWLGSTPMHQSMRHWAHHSVGSHICVESRGRTILLISITLNRWRFGSQILMTPCDKRIGAVMGRWSLDVFDHLNELGKVSEHTHTRYIIKQLGECVPPLSSTFNHEKWKWWLLQRTQRARIDGESTQFITGSCWWIQSRTHECHGITWFGKRPRTTRRPIWQESAQRIDS